MNPAEALPDKFSCTLCHKELKRKKLIECNDCSRLFCRLHIKVNELDCSSLCADCGKKKLHLEISMEMEADILSAKSELKSLQQSLKKAKHELATLESRLSEASCAKEALCKPFPDRVQLLESQLAFFLSQSASVLSQHASCSSASQLLHSKLAATQARFQQSESEKTSCTADLAQQRAELTKLSAKLQSKTEMIHKYTPYQSLRNTLCAPCKHKLKREFSDSIINGNQGHSSLISSVLAASPRKSSKSVTELSHKAPKADSCNCSVF
jgi:DNA repair exonuclease SbcCD ATPase subunit